jgi:hypothetical protein
MSTNDEVTRDKNPETVAPATPDSIPINQVEISELNPRHGEEQNVDSLVEDIRDNKGLLQQMLLRKTRTGKWEVIAGGRRFNAIKRMRGEDEGEIRSGEFRLVDWDDNRCIRAAMSENREREDLSPLAEGRHLNNLAGSLEQGGGQISDGELAAKTGLNRQRVNEMRSLAMNFEMLPKSWQESLRQPANRRPNDNVITPTHFKHVRSRLPEGVSEIDRDLLEAMETAAKKQWSARQFEKALKGATEDGNENGATGSKKQNETSGERTRDPKAEPDYSRVLRALNSALAHTGSDDELADLIQPIIDRAESIIEARKAESEKDDDADPKAA